MSFQRRSAPGTGDPVRVRTDGKSTADANPAEATLRARVSKNSAYDKYKASLNEFFDGSKPLPENLREMLKTRPGATDHMDGVDEEEAGSAEPEQASAAAAPEKPRSRKGEGGTRTRRRVASGGDNLKSLLDGVRKANSPREVEAAVDTLFAAGHKLPEDAEILSKALGHKDESVIERALSGLLAIADNGSIKSPRLLQTRIENVALLAGSRDVTDLCDQLKAKLG